MIKTIYEKYKTKNDLRSCFLYECQVIDELHIRYLKYPPELSDMVFKASSNNTYYYIHKKYIIDELAKLSPQEINDLYSLYCIYNYYNEKRTLFNLLNMVKS